MRMWVLMFAGKMLRVLNEIYIKITKRMPTAEMQI